MPKKKNKRPIPLTRQPIVMKSRKRARQVTTQFHKLTHKRERAVQDGDNATVGQIDGELQAMGGRAEYQRASQLSTSFHSTSKWALGSLARNGWLGGIPYNISEEDEESSNLPAADGGGDEKSQISKEKQKQRKTCRRETRILEVGAINTELLDAAAEMTTGSDAKKKKYRLDVRAIDLHSMDERIEEADFLTLPFISEDVNERYDVIVCSMVINSVPTPLDRGKMLARLYHHLLPGGLLFLTLPKYCLTKSAFLTLDIFEEMLSRGGGVGFEVEVTKQSPKVAFFVCRRPTDDADQADLKKLWKNETIRNKGKKFPNQFSVVLVEKEVFGLASADGN